MLILLSLAAAVAAPPQLLGCQEIDQAIETSRKEPVPVPRTATDIQITSHHSLCGGWEIIDLWKSWSGRQVVWSARRKIMDRQGHLKEDLLNSEYCPALISALENLDNLKVGLSVIPSKLQAGASLMPPPLPPTDGTTFTIRILSARQTDQSTSMVTISSSVGAVATWVISGLDPLKGCWRPRA
jgi:hypothetical protein